MKCIVCQTHEQRDHSSFCGLSCATVWSIIQAEKLILSNEQIKKLALNRLQSLNDYMEY